LIAGVLTQSGVAAVAVTDAKAAVQIVQNEAGTDAYLTDVTALDSTQPTASNVASAQQDAMTSNSIAIPVGSLAVSGGSLVSQMNLISTNASALQTTVCDPNSSLYVVSSGIGGGG